MKKVFSSNPYYWFLLAVIKVAILIFAFMNLLNHPFFFFIFVIVAILIAYFVIPKYMKFKLVLEFNKEGIVFERDKMVNWDRIQNIVKRTIDSTEYIDFSFLDSTNKEIVKSYNANELYIDSNKLITKCLNFKNNFKKQ